MTAKKILLLILLAVTVLSLNRVAFSADLNTQSPQTIKALQLNKTMVKGNDLFDKEICIANSSTFPESSLKRMFPDYEIEISLNWDSHGYVVLSVVDHIAKNIRSQGIRSDLSETLGHNSCFQVDNVGNLGSKKRLSQ